MVIFVIYFKNEWGKAERNSTQIGGRCYTHGLFEQAIKETVPRDYKHGLFEQAIKETVSRD